MRVALGLAHALDASTLRFAEQLGVGGVVLNTPSLPGPPWAVEDLVALRERCARFGLRLEAVENTPLDFYLPAILGTDERERCLELYVATVRSLGEAGIPVLGFHWMARGVTRTSFTAAARGGALVTEFRMDRFEDRGAAFGREYAEEELWDTLAVFLDRVVPAAEEAGVRLAVHPDDPPVPALEGVPALLRSIDALERAMRLRPSPNLGVELCLGTLSESTDDPIAAIRRLGRGGHIAYVHFRDVRGTVPAFRECSLGDGNYSPAEAMRALRDVGFDGFLIDDHVPAMSGDPRPDEGFHERGHAHGTGYLQGLLSAVASEHSAAAD